MLAFRSIKPMIPRHSLLEVKGETLKLTHFWWIHVGCKYPTYEFGLNFFNSFKDAFNDSGGDGIAQW